MDEDNELRTAFDNAVERELGRLVRENDCRGADYWRGHDLGRGLLAEARWRVARRVREQLTLEDKTSLEVYREAAEPDEGAEPVRKNVPVSDVAAGVSGLYDTSGIVAAMESTKHWPQSQMVQSRAEEDAKNRDYSELAASIPNRGAERRADKREAESIREAMTATEAGQGGKCWAETADGQKVMAAVFNQAVRDRKASGVCPDAVAVVRGGGFDQMIKDAGEDAAQQEAMTATEDEDAEKDRLTGTLNAKKSPFVYRLILERAQKDASCGLSQSCNPYELAQALAWALNRL